MAGKAKSVYLTVTPIGALKSVLNKVFFDAKSLREYLASEEFQTKYPADKFTVYKDTY